MKAKLLVAALSAAFLAGCSSDTVISDIATDDPIAKGYEPVQLSLGRSNAVVTKTRGQGTIGSTVDSLNTWFYEDIRVIMLQRPDQDHPISGYTQGLDNVKNFDNSFIARPSQVGTNNVGLDYITYSGDTRYYPATGLSQFFAYHIDDAALHSGSLIGRANLKLYVTDASPKVAPDLTETKTVDSDGDSLYLYTTDFQIDGSQDLMAGKATNYLDNDHVGFGALTARRAVIPNIVMEHLLTRFEFGVIPGMRFRSNESGGNDTITDIKNVKITGISMLTNTKGTMTVAYLNYEEAKDSLIRTASELIPASTWASSNTAGLDTVKLKATPAAWKSGTSKKDMVALDTLISFADKDSLELVNHAKQRTPYAVPDSTAALFVQPDLASYTLLVNVVYTLATATGTQADVIPLTVKLNGGTTFEPGKSYHVDLVIYGPNEIEVQVSLVPWKNAGTITIDTEDPENPGWVPTPGV